MTEELILKYAIGIGILLLCLFVFLFVRRLQRREHHLIRSIPLHVIEAATLSGLVIVAKTYALMSIEDYDLRIITPKTIDLIAVVLFALIAMRQLFLLINRMESHQINKGSDPTSAKVISRTLKVAIVVFLVLMFGDRLGFSLSGLMAFGGIGGIAIGLAGKDILSNFFSGVMLYFDRPFNIGDWVRSPDRSIEGTVVEIGWRMTKIITFDSRPLYVPNSIFASISVENPSRMANRRINTTIGLRYQDADKIGAVVQDIEAMLKQHDDIDGNQTILVYFDAFGESSLNIMVYCFTKTTDWAKWLAAQQDVYLKIIEIVRRHDANFAYPSRTMFLQPGADIGNGANNENRVSQ